MKILFVSAEVYPFSKVGGLGDVAGALTAELASLGIDVTVITPAYKSIDKNKFGITNNLYHFPVTIGNDIEECGLSCWQSLDRSHYRVYFLENEKYFGSRGIYNDTKGHFYSDSAKRFLLFSKATLEIIKLLNLKPDIIHCNDNHCAMLPVYQKVKPHDYPEIQNTKILLTLHNIGYQGIVEMSERRIYDLPDGLFSTAAPLEWYGEINPLKAGIIYADAISTVSPTHAREIVEDDTMSAGLKNVLLSTGKPIHGILNGVDYSEWSPETDRYIAKAYSPKTIDNKYHNKVALMSETGFDLKYFHKKPLIGMVSRLVEQKGIPILINALERILTLDVTMIILGSGEPEYEQSLQKFAHRFSEKYKLYLSYNNPLSHKIMAGCDIFLMPSLYEPCGITQMAALKYGTVPVVHKTGGLADTIIQWDGKRGNGFLFESNTSGHLIQAVDEAIKNIHDKKKWRRIMRNGMQADFSWRRAAEQYVKLYHSLI